MVADKPAQRAAAASHTLRSPLVVLFRPLRGLMVVGGTLTQGCTDLPWATRFRPRGLKGQSRA